MRQDDRARIGKLVLSAANRVLREVLIDRKHLTIGRRPHNDLLLDDLTVSGDHAVVHTVAGELVIQDLKSRNGTLVNGAPVVQQQLAHGDFVDIGIYRLVYKVERVETKAPNGFWSAFMPPSQPLVPTNLAGQRTSAWVPSLPGRYPGPSRPGKPPSPPHSTKPATSTRPPTPVGLPGPVDPAFPADAAVRTGPALPEVPATSAWPAPPAHRPGPGGSTDRPVPQRPGASDPAQAGGDPDGHLSKPVDRRRANPPLRPPEPRTMPSLPPEGPRPASLHFLGGHDAGRRMMLERPIVSIRNGLGQVAVVARRLNGYFVTHLEGPAYPLVNGESIGLGAHLLREADLIELAGTIIQFSLEG